MSEAAYPRFSDEEYARRYARVRALMREEGVDALLLYGTYAGQPDVHYLANFLPRQECYLVFPLEGEPALLVQYYNHVPDAREVAVVADVAWAGANTAASVVVRLSDHGLATASIGLVGAIPYQHHGLFRVTLPQARFSDLTGAYRRLRLVKSDEEIVWTRRGSALSDLAVRALAEELRIGMREHELGAIVQSAYLRAGGQHAISFLATTAMERPRRFAPAQTWTDRALERGDVILTEISAAYFGYSGQLLRPFAVGTAPTARYARIYAVAEEAYRRVVATLRPGATARDLLAAAAFVDDSGFTICDDLVHGYVGGYLPPVLRTPATQDGPVADLTFAPGMMVVVQPNVIDGEAGVQVGDLVLVTESGAESLHRYPLGFGVVGA